MNPSSGVLCWEFNDNMMLKSTVNPSQYTVRICTVNNAIQCVFKMYYFYSNNVILFMFNITSPSCNKQKCFFIHKSIILTPPAPIKVIGNLLYHIISALFTAGIDAATLVEISVAYMPPRRHLAHMRSPRRIADSSSVRRHNSWKAEQAQAISKPTKALAAGDYYSFKSVVI